MLLGEIAVVLRLHFATVVGLDIAAFQNPLAAQGGQAFLGSAFEIRIAPWPRAVIDADGLVLFDAPVESLGVVQGDLAHRHFHLRVDFSLDINSGRCGQLRAGFVVFALSGGFFWADHGRF